MKNILFLLIYLFSMNKTWSQLEFRNSNTGRMMNLADRDGQSLLKNYDPDISGFPFLSSDWEFAKLTLKNSKVVGPFQVKLNIENNELFFIDSAGHELIALYEGIVKKVEFINLNNKDGIRYVFKSGYPAIDNKNEFYFYQLLSEGKTELIAKRFKYIRTNKDELSGEITKEFIDGMLVLYVYDHLKIQTFQPNKGFVTALLKDKEPAVNQFMEKNKINLKKTADLVKLFSFYNESEK